MGRRGIRPGRPDWRPSSAMSESLGGSDRTMPLRWWARAMTHCTHGYPAMHHLKVGDTCAICNTIVTVVASPATTGHRGGEGIGDALASEIRTALPAATSLPGCSPQTVPAATATATVPEAVAVAPIEQPSLFTIASAPTATSDGSVCPSAPPAATVPILPQGAPGPSPPSPRRSRTRK